ncbi:MAG TPA: hypothetical protein VFA97_13285 [Gaiellaceae bacterium]|nr:hypothetical protein [Gaiellaceae bacterium]
MSDERNRLDKNDENEQENDDVEAHRLDANLEGDSDESDDVEAHRLD